MNLVLAIFLGIIVIAVFVVRIYFLLKKDLQRLGEVLTKGLNKQIQEYDEKALKYEMDMIHLQSMKEKEQ